MSTVQVVIWRGKTGKYNIEVSLASTKKKSIFARSEVDAAKVDNVAALRNLVAAAGGACAEYLDGRYGETHDPSECARLAVLDFDRECRLMAELSNGFTKRLNSLLLLPLSAPERAQADRLKFITDRGASPTLNDSEWVNKVLSRLHRGKK